MPDLARTLIRQEKCFRLVPSCYPPIQLFESLLDPGELDAAYAFESLTNDRVRDQIGEIAMVPPEERLVGPGITAIMAAFTHIGTASRFTDGSYGVYYAGLDLETAIEEASFSQSRRLGATSEPSQTVQVRLYIAGINAQLVDLRSLPEYHVPGSWAASQSLGRELRAGDEQGVVYDSVRKPGGFCIAAFRTTALVPPALQGSHYEFHWDGERITHTSRIIQYSCD